MQRFLIITADDFGLHEAVNEAVEESARRGVLTAASLMVGARAAADAVRRARELPQLRVGLHLVLADGMAVLPHGQVPSITDRDGRMNERMFVNGVRFFALRHVQRQLEAEIRAQFAAFARTGLELDHVNVHKHFHLHPTLLAMILRIGADYGLAAVRVPDEPLWFATRERTWLAGAAAGMLKPMIALMKQRLDAAAVFHNDAIFGIATTGAMDEATLLRILARLPPGVTEIYLHPATRRPHALTPTMRGYRHAEELAALLSPDVGAAIAPDGIARGGYADARRHRIAAAAI
jgi:hopanoid biosynthesis associated protein HpnK